MIFLFLQEIYKDRKKFSRQVFEVASSDLVNMGITVVSYTLKDVRDDMVSLPFFFIFFFIIQDIVALIFSFLEQKKAVTRTNPVLNGLTVQTVYV